MSPGNVTIGRIAPAPGVDSRTSVGWIRDAPPKLPRKVSVCNSPLPFGPGGVLPSELHVKVTEAGPSTGGMQKVERPLLPRNGPAKFDR
jgi:hypothetical protein